MHRQVNKSMIQSSKFYTRQRPLCLPPPPSTQRAYLVWPVRCKTVMSREINIGRASISFWDCAIMMVRYRRGKRKAHSPDKIDAMNRNCPADLWRSLKIDSKRAFFLICLFIYFLTNVETKLESSISRAVLYIVFKQRKVLYIIHI